MDRSQSGGHSHERRVSRVCGDGPVIYWHTLLEVLCFPRVRGWTADSMAPEYQRFVFPARAGMDLPQRGGDDGATTGDQCFPRVRGWTAVSGLLTASAVLSLAAQCATGVPYSDIKGITQVESGFGPLAIHVNRVAQQPMPARTKDEAIATASRLITQGYSVDIGLAQINRIHLGHVRHSDGSLMTLADLFDPCGSLSAARQVLLGAYNAGPGNADLGIDNGYAARVISAGSKLPTIGVRNARPAPASAVPQQPQPAPTLRNQFASFSRK